MKFQMSPLSAIFCAAVAIAMPLPILNTWREGGHGRINDQVDRYLSTAQKILLSPTRQTFVDNVVSDIIDDENGGHGDTVESPPEPIVSIPKCDLCTNG